MVHTCHIEEGTHSVMDRRVNKLAELLVNYSVAVKPGDKVTIDGKSTAEPLLEAVYAEVLRAGGFPLMAIRLPREEEVLFRCASSEQLQHIPEPLKLVAETYDAGISLIAEQNTKALTKVDPTKMVLHSTARAGLMQTYLHRAASGAFRSTVAVFPTNALAQDAEMSLTEYEDFVYSACMPDMDDPVGHWKRLSGWQQSIIEWLTGKESVHVTGLETDLHFSISGRTFVNCDGKVNMPDGEVYTGPVEDSIEGHVCFSYPAIYGGREVTGVRLWFEGGQVVKATAEKNEDFLLETLDTDEGARRIGEFGIGTNEGINRFTGQILFDEKINGSFHMALGAGFPRTGSLNESAIHWDLICDLRDNGEIRVDNEPLYREGEFAIQFK